MQLTGKHSHPSAFTWLQGWREAGEVPGPCEPQRSRCRDSALTLGREGQAETTIEHQCTASIGIALFIDHRLTADDILREADAAMYRAKTAGRNRIRFHDDRD